MNANRLRTHTEPTVLFIDMNSFFASCEQQDNYWLRGRPVAVCVYTGKQGCVIAPSVEAKQRGVKTGMRLDEATLICPDLVPVETHPNRYRDYHVKIIGVLKRFADEVLPKSIDEAVVDLTRYQLAYSSMTDVARRIKQAIRTDVGDYLRCSIGIAPNAFLAKLASNLQKPDGLSIISPANIDEVLGKLALTDLPGIAHGMATRLRAGGINTPLELRYASPDRLKLVCKSIVGWHWHLRLNFGGEVDMATQAYKQMQAIRSVSGAQRQSVEMLETILRTLCLTLERRMVRQQLFCRRLHGWVRYWNGQCYQDELAVSVPMQDGIDMFQVLCGRMTNYQQAHGGKPLLNPDVRQLGVGVTDFIPANRVQYGLFEDNTRKDKFRQTLYAINDRFGPKTLMRATELNPENPVKELIGFGSIKDLHELTDWELV
ncbi:DNA polymerase Y family protein [Fibrella aquatilis]|uniref:DNA polymerase IV n=1 Tax=Fibrella aquatilis TaxID=2817059 RepID=A0A939G987_9BACT|nr:DNA polymerase IV [Fibrella aquatilis]MBO0934579.1 DNA polymerase IV [Fibrella aquatilis]